VNTNFLTLLAPFLKYAGAQAITAESSLRDLGLDSMHAVELLFALEDAYEVIFPDELLIDATFATAGSLWAAIDSLLAGSTAGAR
jgi:acyl carrier protein